MTVSQLLAEVHLWLWSYRSCELPGCAAICLGFLVAAVIGLFGAYRTHRAAVWRFRRIRPRAGWWLASMLGFLGVLTFSSQFRLGGVLLALAVAAAIALFGDRRVRRAAVPRKHRARLQAQGWFGSAVVFFGMLRCVSPLQRPWDLLGLAVSAVGLYAMLGGDRHGRIIVFWVRRQRLPRLSFPFWCLVWFFVGNALMSLLMAGPVRWWVVEIVLQPAILGMVGGQAAVHSIWCVFASLPWIQRFLAGAISAIVLFVGFVIPPVLFERHWRLDRAEELAVPLLCLPLLLLAAQTPMWIMRFWFRWRIVPRDAETSGHFEPLRIGGLLVATAVVSLALGAMRLTQSLPGRSSNSNLTGGVVAAFVIMVVSAITVLPAILACLRARRLLRALALAFTATATVPAAFVGLGMLIGVQAVSWREYVVGLGLAGVYFVCLTAPLLIARRKGCRLLCRRD